IGNIAILAYRRDLAEMRYGDVALLPADDGFVAPVYDVYHNRDELHVFDDSPVAIRPDVPKGCFWGLSDMAVGGPDDTYVLCQGNKDDAPVGLHHFDGSAWHDLT